MATLTPTLKLESIDLTNDTLSLTTTGAITNANLHTTGIARRPITSTAKGTAAGQVTLYTADDFAATAYIYVKNIDTTATDYIYVYDDSSTGDPVVLKLAGGDFAYLPTIADKTLKAYATTSGTIVEFAVFGTDQ